MPFTREMSGSSHPQDWTRLIAFARKDPDSPGRLYVGILSPHTSPMTAMVRLHASALQGTRQVTGTKRQEDAYWTLVSYFNSKQGMATNAASDDFEGRPRSLNQTVIKDENY